MKFLHQASLTRETLLHWPRQDDVYVVHESSIVFGPVLKDFKVPALKLRDIVAAFKTGKSERKDCEIYFLVLVCPPAHDYIHVQFMSFIFIFFHIEHVSFMLNPSS